VPLPTVPPQTQVKDVAAPQPHLSAEQESNQVVTDDPYLEYYSLPTTSQPDPLFHHQPQLHQPGDNFEVPDYLESPALPSVINPYEYPSNTWTEIVHNDSPSFKNQQIDDDIISNAQQDYSDEYDSYPFGSSASRLPAVILPEALNEVGDDKAEELVDEELAVDNQEDEHQFGLGDGWQEVVEISTSKPRYVIRKLSRKRVPKTLIKERRERALGGSEYSPVHRGLGGEVRLVMVKGHGYIPEHSPMAGGQ